MKKYLLAVLAMLMLTLSLALTGCGSTDNTNKTSSASQLVYGSHDYTRINPAIDEHGEINLLLFNGLTAHDGDNAVIPSLAESWDYDENSLTYTFHLRHDVKWHDDKPFTAKDVKFTLQAIMDPANESENAPNFDDITAINSSDDYTVAITLAHPNAAFLDYMTMPILPEHLLANRDMQNDEFFRHPIGTGPYKLTSWEPGQAIVLTKNTDYFRATPKIDTVIFKITADDNTEALQLAAGELDLALLDPKNAAKFDQPAGFTRYDLKTADYRGIMFNFNNPYWQKNRDLIPAICYALNRQAIVDSILLGQGMTAYGPLQRNIYNDDSVNHYDYNPTKAEQLLQQAGCTKNANGIYERHGEEIGFTISVKSGEQDRLDIAESAAQQLRDIGINCTIDIPVKIDWKNQQAFLIGWGSPFDADDHTYKIFGTDKAANYSAYSNADVDKYLKLARKTSNTEARANYYHAFQQALAKDPAYAFICYIDANYIAKSNLHGISPNTVLGHHGVGIFWNIHEWSLD